MAKVISIWVGGAIAVGLMVAAMWAWRFAPEIAVQSAGRPYVAKLGIGVAPLADTKFNAAKSWLKMAEMAALGVPCVVSPRAEYMRLHEQWIGSLAE